MNAAAIGIVDSETPAGSVFDEAAAPQTGSAGAAVETPEAQAPTADPEPAGAAPAGAPTEAFFFAGREWPSREAAENDWRTWEGRIQAEQARVRDYEARINDYWDYVQAVSRENEELRGQIPQAQTKEEPEAPAIDFDRIGRVMEIARNQGIDPLAMGIRDYAAQAEKVYEHKLESRLASIEQPVQAMQQTAAEQMADRQMFLWARDLKDSNGNPAFPELQAANLDENLVVNIHRLWKQLANEFGAKYAYSAPGFDYAYRLAKDLTPRQNQTHGMARDAQGRFVSSQAAAAAASDLSGNLSNPAQPRAQRSQVQEMLEELTAMKPVKIGSTDLGFYE